MNPLTLIPARFRKYVYGAYSATGVTVGALAVGGIDVGKAPDILAYLGTALGLVAISNITTTHGDSDSDD